MKKIELITSHYRETPIPIREVKDSKSAYHLCVETWNHLLIDTQEQMNCYYFNNKNDCIAYSNISTGGIEGTIADTRIILRNALLSGATAMILAHNHPSGNNKPSENDIRLTKQIDEASRLHQIKLLDHIIITKNNGYTSLQDEGLF